MRAKIVRLLQAAMEAIVLALVCLSPWAFGANGAVFEFPLFAGIALLLGLWSLRILVEFRTARQQCPVAWCLVGLFLLGVWQLTPLPHQALRWLAPPTAERYGQLLPAQPELLPGGEVAGNLAPAPGSTLSLYPGATRALLLKVAAVLALFAVVRINIASAASFRRLAWAGVANGTLLALFGLVQHFTSSPKTVYWIFPTDGLVFGPFINYNHFAFYLNICVGLGLGLLLAIRRPAVCAVGDDPPEGTRQEPAAPATDQDGLGLFSSALLSPARLWIAMALALMISASVFSASRGGFLALGGAALTVAVTAWLRGGRSSCPGLFQLATGLAVGGVVLVFLAWFGYDRVANRLSSLWQDKVFQESRLPPWAKAWSFAKSFPVWGTGFGTFSTVEALRRTAPQYAAVVYQHAHNDYLEILAEGGLAALGLALLAIALLYRLGYLGLRRHAGSAGSALAVGGLFGLTTIVLHSSVEFGLHMPAIAVLATVLCAQLAAMGKADSWHPGAPSAGGPSLHLYGLGPVAPAVAALVLATILYSEGEKAYQVDRLRLTVSGLASSADAAVRPVQIRLLDAAARLAPRDAGLQFQLGLMHLDLFERRNRGRDVGEAAGMVLAATIVADPALAPVPFWTVAPVARQELARRDDSQAVQQHLLPALRHFVRARDLCPVMSQPHMRIAAHLRRFARAEALGVYLDRAKLLEPSDPELWYFCGLQELADGRADVAWKTWRQCLELSDRYLAPILERSGRSLSKQAILRDVLPDRPAVLAAAAVGLYPAAGAERQQLLQRALDLLAKQAAPLEAPDYYTRARIHQALGQPRQAIASFQAAVAQEPRQAAWRLEFARLLYQEGHLEEAYQQLAAILRQEPANAAARDLLEAVAGKRVPGGED